MISERKPIKTLKPLKFVFWSMCYNIHNVLFILYVVKTFFLKILNFHNPHFFFKKDGFNALRDVVSKIIKPKIIKFNPEKMLTPNYYRY